MTAYNHWFIRARLKTRQLLLLQALAEEGNIHRAATVLSMTQPAASKLLKDLEDVLGVQTLRSAAARHAAHLVWRGHDPPRPRMALASLDQAYDEVRGAQGRALRAGERGGDHHAGHHAAALRPSPRSRRSTPTLRVNVQIETSDVLMERLAQGKLDMVVGRLFERHDKTEIRYEAIVEEPVCATVRAGPPAAQATPGWACAT